MRRHCSAFATLLTVVVAGGFACSNSTVPASQKRSSRSPKHPLIGVFDVTTTLDSFSFEGVGARCTPFAPTCALVRPVSGGFLAGALTIGDSLVVFDSILPRSGIQPVPARDTTLARLPIVRASFLGRACANIDLSGSSSCVAFADTVRTEYSVVVRPVITSVNPGSQRELAVTLRDTALSQHTLDLVTTRAIGDTALGTVRWQTASGRNPPTFYGTFRAVRRP